MLSLSRFLKYKRALDSARKFITTTTAAATTGSKRMTSTPKPSWKMAESFTYPETYRDETMVDVYHGKTVRDPYRWLEDPDTEETKKFVDAQNAITRPYIDSYPYKNKINKIITDLWDFPKISPPSKHGNRFYQYKNSGLQNQSVIYVQDELKSTTSKVFLDPNELSSDGTIALSDTKFTDDGKTFAYGLSDNGSDWIEIHFKDAETHKDYPEVLTKAKFTTMAWTIDGKGFFYAAYLHQQGKADGSETNTNEFQKLYYHKLGTPQSEDVIVVEFTDPQLRIGACVSHCGKYLVVTPIKGCKNNLLYFSRIENIEIKGLLELETVVSELEADYEYITNTGSTFVFKTNKNAPNYRVIAIDFEDLEKEWVELLPEHSLDVIDWVRAINHNQLVLCRMQDVKHILSLHKLENGEKIHDFKLPLGTVSTMTGKYNHSEFFFSFYSFLTPNIIYRVDLSGGKVKEEIFHETKVGDFDPSKFECKQIFYESKDSTRIPMFIISKKGMVLDGSNPCLLYGYGGFNITMSPSFSVSRLVFVDVFDGLYVVANIRGGGEYGDTWHNAGRFGNKQNCFDDFQYAAKYLINNKYTKPEKLTIQGGSNGGLLVAACINQAPHLFGAAICQVGVLDMFRYDIFTIGYAWKSDYGCAQNAEDFEYLSKYSPLHNITIPGECGQYPATLLLTADHDDRVVPLHSLKFIAELQHKIGSLPQQKNPLMIRVETKAGHGAGKPTSKIIEEATDIYSFIAKSLNLEYKR